MTLFGQTLNDNRSIYLFRNVFSFGFTFAFLTNVFHMISNLQSIYLVDDFNISIICFGTKCVMFF